MWQADCSFRAACWWLLMLTCQCTLLVPAVIQVTYTQELLERLVMSLHIRYLHVLVAEKSCAWDYSHHLLKVCLCCPTMAGWAAIAWLCLLQLCDCTWSVSPCEHEAMQTPRVFLCVWLPLSKQCGFLGSDLWQRVCSKDSWDLIKREHEDNIFQFTVRHSAAWWDNRYWCVEYRRMFSLKC